MQHTMTVIQSRVMQPDVRQSGTEQVKEKARKSVMERLAKARVTADRDNQERWEREGRMQPGKKHDMGL